MLLHGSGVVRCEDCDAAQKLRALKKAGQACLFHQARSDYFDADAEAAAADADSEAEAFLALWAFLAGAEAEAEPEAIAEAEAGAEAIAEAEAEADGAAKAEAANREATRAAMILDILKFLLVYEMAILMNLGL